MTVFSRNDKDPVPAPAPQAQPRPAAQATAQPLAAARPAAPIPAPQTPGVSVISKALKITGQLESTEDIEINGQIEGDVRGVHVTVGSNAKVKGTVYGDAVELAGTVEGKIEAKKVVLTSTAHMSGDVIHQDVRIESGAYMSGHLKPDYAKPAAGFVQPAKPPVREAVAPASAPAADKPTNGAAATVA